MKKICTFSLMLLAAASTAFGQQDQNRKKEKITIQTKDGAVDLEDYLEGLGEKIERTVESLVEGIDARVDDNNFRFSIDWDFDKMDREIEEAVRGVVGNMDIELNDLDREEFEDSQINFNGNLGRSGKEIMDEIAIEYGSQVEKIEHMKIRIREEKVMMDVDFLLEDGRVISKFYESESGMKRPRRSSGKHPE